MVWSGQGRSAFSHVRGRRIGGLSANGARDELAEGILFPLLVGVLPSHERVLPSGMILRESLEVATFALAFETAPLSGLVRLDVPDLPLVGSRQFLCRELVRAGLDAPLG